jgi:UDP-N-acetylmuramate dehydrogenase
MLGEIKHNVPLKPLSYLHVGGTARHFFIAHSVKSLIEILNWWTEKNGLAGLKKILIVGGMTNILFPEKVYNGLVVVNKINFIKKIGRETIFAGSGTSMARILNFCFKNNLSELEWSSKLPGSLGGAVRGNAGAFGGEIKNSIIKVISVDIGSDGKINISIRSKRECDFGYRTSIFKKGNKNQAKHIIVGVYLKLKRKSSMKKEKERAEEIKNYRWSKHPMNLPSLGSTFKNVDAGKVSKKVLRLFGHKIKNDPIPVIPVAVLLDAAGLRGFASGDAKFSEKHVNFIVNFNKASVSDIKKLILTAKRRVKNKFGIDLKEEIEIVE